MDEAPEYVELVVGDGADLTVIWLHGLGADGHDFVPIVPELELPIGVKFLFPHAPIRPVTINGGVRMRAWYDIYGFGPDVPEDAAGLDDAAARIAALLGAETERGARPERTVLAGFSQGGAVALHLALGRPLGLAGVIALSTYLPLASRHAAAGAPGARGLQVLMAHGRADPIVPFSLAEASRDALTALGCAVDWRTYDIGHHVCAEEIRDIAAWLRARAAAAAAHGEPRA